MSAAANAAAFLSMRRRLPQDAGPTAHVSHAGPRTHYAHVPVAAPAPQPNPVRVAVVEPAAEVNPAQVIPVQVSYRKRRSILR